MTRNPQRCDGPGLRRPPDDEDDQIISYYSHHKQQIIHTLLSTHTHLPGEFISVYAEGGPTVHQKLGGNQSHRKNASTNKLWLTILQKTQPFPDTFYKLYH